jgi:hypothetical protein
MYDAHMPAALIHASYPSAQLQHAINHHKAQCLDPIPPTHPAAPAAPVLAVVLGQGPTLDVLGVVGVGAQLTRLEDACRHRT